MKVFKVILLLFITTLLLPACGGGSNGDTDGNTPTVTEVRGQLISAKRLVKHTQEAIGLAVQGFGDEIPRDRFLYPVTLYRLTYSTIDGYGEAVDASGVIALPDKMANFPSPLLSFQHGSLFYDKEAPSNDLQANSPPALIAAMGYITVAADYVGYGASLGTPHPYLLKDASAAVVIDLLKAAQTWLNQQDIPLNGQLFLSGYSQGGYVTMAAHQALEQQALSGLQVVASIPAAGPYHLTATLNDLVSSDRIQQALNSIASRQQIAPSAATIAQRLPDAIADPLADYVMDQLLPDDSDIVFQDTVIREFIRDGASAIAENNVHDWKAIAPVRLFHGRDDETVPFLNARNALTAMQARGSSDVMLVECLETPAGHEECILPYGILLNTYFQSLAQGL